MADEEGKTQNQDQNQDQDQNNQGNQDNADAGKSKEEEKVEDINLEFVEEDVTPPDKDDNKGTDDEEEVDPEDKKVISKTAEQIVDQRFKSQEQRQSRLSEVTEFLNQEGNEAFKPYATKIKEYATNPHLLRFKSVDNALGAILGAKTLMKIGAAVSAAADQEAAGGKTGGNTSRPTGDKASNFDSMSSEDFEATVQQVKSGNYKG